MKYWLPVREQNVQVAAGQIGGQPALPGTQFQYIVNAQGRLQTEQEFGNIVVKSGANGETTYLRDVARLELGPDNYALRSMLDGGPAVAIPVFQLPGANALKLSDAVRAKMKELAKNFPDGVSYEIDYDPTVFVRSSIESVIHTLFEAVLLVVLVVVVFLQTWRASVIPLVAVPVAIIGTLAALLLAGFTLNSLTLFGLVLATGIVVDDAIVVVENIERKIEEGLNPHAAAHAAMAEVTRPIISIALVLCAVFIPVAFVSGLTGQFYRQFGITIAASTIISTFNSLTLSPALAALLLKPRSAPADVFQRGINKVLGKFFGVFNRGFERASELYGRGVQRPHGDSPGRPAGVRWSAGGDVGHFPRGTRRLHSRARQAISHRHRAIAGCRLARSYREGSAADVDLGEGDAGGGSRDRIFRAFGAGIRQFEQRRRVVLPTQVVRRA